MRRIACSVVLRLGARRNWTSSPDHTDPQWQRTTWSRRHGADDHDRCNGMRPRTAGTRSCLRWPLLYRRSNDAHLLSPGLSCAARTIEERASFPSAAAAEADGFRPCLRCRPETAPFSPAWNGSRTTVARGLRLIVKGALDGNDASVVALAAKLGVGERHLARLFIRHLGASPSQVARTARVQRAKRLLDTTERPMSQIPLGCWASAACVDLTQCLPRSMAGRQRNCGGEPAHGTDHRCERPQRSGRMRSAPEDRSLRPGCQPKNEPAAREGFAR